MWPHQGSSHPPLCFFFSRREMVEAGRVKLKAKLQSSVADSFTTLLNTNISGFFKGLDENSASIVTASTQSSTRSWVRSLAGPVWVFSRMEVVCVDHLDTSIVTLKDGPAHTAKIVTSRFHPRRYKIWPKPTEVGVKPLNNTVRTTLEAGNDPSQTTDYTHNNY